MEVLGTSRTIFRVDILDYVLKRETEKQPLKTDGFSVGENALMTIEIIRKRSGGRNLRRGININQVCNFMQIQTTFTLELTHTRTNMSSTACTGGTFSVVLIKKDI